MRLLTVCLWLFLAASAHAQVPGPGFPAKYKAIIRYHIIAPRDTHVARYDAMIEHLQNLDFEFTPPLEKLPNTDREDPKKNQIVGLVPGKNAVRILHNPSVASILLVPETFALPEQPEQQVHVRLEISSGIPPERQRELGEQVRLVLGLLGFREAIGYDQQGYSKKPFTRIAGTVPAGKLDLLLRDLRTQPAGWFAPVISPDDLPSPLRQVNPILITEVMPDPEPLKEIALESRPAPHLEKLTPELWTLVQQKEQENRAVRVQILLTGKPNPDDKDLRFNLLHAAPSMLFEGWLGQTVTATVPVNQVPRLAALQAVSALRLARSVKVDVDPGVKVKTDNQAALDTTGLTRLHQEGHKGRGVRLAIIDSDFRGWDKLIAAKKLPASTRFIDLTGERDLDLVPQPAGDPERIGHGVQCALAAHLAAPEAQLNLIRIDATAPHQIYELIQYFRGGWLSEALRRRQDEISADRQALRNRRAELLEERRKLLEDFTEESEIQRNYGFLGPVMGWIFSERDVHYQRLRYQEKLEKALAERFDRFLVLVDQTQQLKGISLAASTINWSDGYAVGGASTLSRWFHLQGHSKLLWFQAAGNTRGQAWTGLFRDTDGNGVMEFARPETLPARDRWTHELNFLGWQVHEAEATLELPVQSRLRLSVQWREPHDEEYFARPGETDLYLEPLADLQVHVLRQRDPELKTLPGDAFEIVGRSSKLPVRLEHIPGHSIYEHSVEFTVDKASRYAVRVERQLPTRWVLREDSLTNRPTFALLQDLVPTGLRPRGVATLTALEKTWELRVRMFVEVLDDTTRTLGRPILHDHATEQGTLGVPADARGIITVGALDAEGKPMKASTAGAPAFQDLGHKPDIHAPAGLEVLPDGMSAYGTSLATPFAAGWAASMMSSGLTRDQVFDYLQQQPGQQLRRKKS